MESRHCDSASHHDFQDRLGNYSRQPPRKFVRIEFASIRVDSRLKIGPPARNCTWNSTFAKSRDRSFTTGRETESRSHFARAGLRQIGRRDRTCTCMGFRPRASETRVYTLHHSPKKPGLERDSHPRPSPYEGAALTAAPSSHRLKWPRPERDAPGGGCFLS